MRKISSIFIILFLLTLVACRMSTDELSAKLKPEIEYKIRDNFNKDFIAKELTIAHSGGNNYEGIMEGSILNNPVSYKVKIVYDGRNTYYEVRPNLNSIFN